MTRTLEVATTYNQKYYDICGKRMIETFIEFWPKDVTLYAYWEEQEPEIFADNVKYINLLEAQPELVKFVERNKDDRKKNGWRPGEWQDGTKEKQIWKYDGVKFSYKVFAQSHRIKNSNSDRLLYLDADTFTHATPNLDYLDEILPEDHLCSYLGRAKNYDETGYYFHNIAHPKSQEWANRMEEIYINDELWDLEQQVDCYTMYWARKTFEDCPQFDLNAYHGGFGNSHPFINTKLGAFLDHLKGNERKRLGSSKIKDFKQSVGTDKSLGLGHGKKGNGMANTKWKKSDYWREAMLKERKLK